MQPHVDRITYFGRTTSRRPDRPFGIREPDRLSHMYVIGKTGTGKTTLLETLIRQDIVNGNGLALIDPHGDLVERVAASIPEARRDDVLYFNLPDPNQPYGYNPLKKVRPDKQPLAAGGLLEVFKKMWPDAWGVRMEHVLRNALLALMEQSDATLPDVLRMCTDKSFRRSVASSLKNQQVQSFWLEEYDKYLPRFRADSIAPIQNKVGAFLADPTLYRVLVKPERMLHMRRIMDRGQILLVNLAKGKLGDDTSSLLGALLLTTLGLAAFSRSDIPEEGRRRFYLYVDEFQTFTTLAVANMISELRKYRVGLILAHQHLHQLETDVRYAVLGNAGTVISFRVGPYDAAFLAKEFEPRFEGVDLLNLPNHTIYLKLMINGEPSRAFSAQTLLPHETGASSDAF